ncbi:2-hydroxy-palmitic acid dioxygenase MPO1-like [Silene latifolia]|uniref:2-hydroxy-palmitic acid dioxygenase MPO1-like n=1 Tax=Silene latifolia TaxID=37657 RepID=UPI003D77297D
MEIFNLEKHFAFYGAYHSNPINILIHMVFVWPILFSGLMLGFYLPMVFFPNQALFTTIVFSVSYICMDKKAGSLGALLCFLCWFGASNLALHLGWSLTWKVVLAAQLICWTAQFLGHGVFEKRAPALLDNLLQAFLMAPFFVLLEALQFSVGYEPYPGFHAKVKILVDANIKEWQEKKKKC